MDENEAIVVLMIFGLTIIVLAVVFLLRLKRDQRREESAQRSLEEHKQIIEDLRLRLRVMFQISRGFVQAENERAIIELVLSQAMDVTGAAGASFVPLDERGQPLGAIRQGDFPFPLPDAWLEYLASPSIRQQCNTCKNHGNVMKSCPLLKGPLSQVVGLYCLPLRRKDLDLGVLNLYLPDEKKIVPYTQDFLHSLIDETALAIEGVRLRSRELAIIRQSQAVRQRVDLPGMLNDLLVGLQTTVSADYILLAIEDYGIDKFSDDIRWEQLVSVGIKPVGDIQKPLNELMQKVYTTGEEYANDRPLGEDSKADKFFDSLIVLPLKTANKVRIGVMLAGKCEGNHFQERQQMIIRTISGQIALVVENTQIMNDLQYKMMAEERGRLAREIHDGLAQTLGFLKLQTAQMRGFLDRGDVERVSHMLSVFYSALTEAYQDAREAIDGLRAIGVRDDGDTYLDLDDAIHRIVRDYQNNDMLPGIKVNLMSHATTTDLSPEVVAQLIRILQEALSNIRKHSGADQIWISSRVDSEDLIVEIKDNGAGFTAEDVPEISRHGLKGMRERAELIGADFQVISRPGMGTTVSIRYGSLERNKLEM